MYNSTTDVVAYRFYEVRDVALPYYKANGWLAMASWNVVPQKMALPLNIVQPMVQWVANNAVMIF